MNLIQKITGQFFVAVHTAQNPTREEWDQFVGSIDSTVKGSLIFTMGGSPSALQRKQMRDAMAQFKIIDKPSAILTDSIIARTAITAINAFTGGTARAFPLNAVNEALLYIKAPLELWPQLKQTLREFQSELGILL
jgi:hypothetical protein